MKFYSLIYYYKYFLSNLPPSLNYISNSETNLLLNGETVSIFLSNISYYYILIRNFI
jgi:hypothetical protein